MERYLAVWGFFENGLDDYDDEIKVKTSSFFTSDKGYHPEEITEIASLPVNGVWRCKNGNHLVVRLD